MERILEGNEKENHNKQTEEESVPINNVFGNKTRERFSRLDKKS